MKICYLCEELLTSENSSTEHIIINAIGGRLKSKSLLCKECNSRFGHKADNELAKQLVYFSNFFRVKRDKGENQVVKGAKTKNGEEYYLLHGDKPARTKPGIIKNDDGRETRYDLSARNRSEMIQLLNGLKRKHPEMDIESLKDQMQMDYYYLNEPLTYNVSVGGDLVNLAIVKTAVNYYIYKTEKTEQVKHLFPYLKGEVNLNISLHYCLNEPIYSVEPNEVGHLIHIHGSAETKILYCLVELFSTFTFIVHLSDQYSGPDFKATYFYDLLLNVKVHKEINHSPAEDAFTPKKMDVKDFDTITKKLNRALAIGSKINTDKEIEGITHRALNKTLEKFKGETIFTEQMASEFINEAAVNYSKFIFRRRIKGI